MKKFIIAVTIVLFIQGCATSYQPLDFGGGYREVQLDENVFKVSFRGNDSTHQERATDFTLLRSAELTLENGFKYFVIVDERSATSTQLHTTSATSHTTSDGFGGFTTNTYGGHTYVTSKPSVTNTIILHKEKPDSVFSYNAEFLYKSMKAKYDID